MPGKSEMRTAALDGKEYPLGYKVVTEDMKSLGLRGNPNIHTYPVGEWYRLPEEEIEGGDGDWGGIWVALRLGGARTLVRYMREQYGEHALIYKAALGDILFENSYRVKTDAVYLYEEVHDPLTEGHLPVGLDEGLYRIADEVFFSKLNTPFSTDKRDSDFYFSVPEPILEGISGEDGKKLLRVLQYDQISPRCIGWHMKNEIPREDGWYAGRDLLLLGTEIAEGIEDEMGRAFARMRIWHHAAGTCHFMSPEHQQIAVDGIEMLLSEFSDADEDTKSILDVWDHFIHNRMEDFLSKDDRMRPLREQEGKA